MKEEEKIIQLEKQIEILKNALKLASGEKGDIFQCPHICNITQDEQCWKCKYKFFIQQSQGIKAINPNDIIHILKAVDINRQIKIKFLLKKQGYITKEELEKILGE